MSVQELSELKQYLNKANIQKIEPPILAIDYGTKNIGLAITDSKGIVAQPLKTIRIKDRNFEKFYEEIIQVVKSYKIKTLVLGVPQAFKEAHLQNIKRILEFQESIEGVTGMKVFLYDESYSTSFSYSNMKEKNFNEKKLKGKIDRIAATYFLQELIDFKNKNS